MSRKLFGSFYCHIKQLIETHNILHKHANYIIVFCRLASDYRVELKGGENVFDYKRVNKSVHNFA